MVTVRASMHRWCRSHPLYLFASKLAQTPIDPCFPFTGSHSPHQSLRPTTLCTASARPTSPSNMQHNREKTQSPVFGAIPRSVACRVGPWGLQDLKSSRKSKLMWKSNTAQRVIGGEVFTTGAHWSLVQLFALLSSLAACNNPHMLVAAAGCTRHSYQYYFMQ